jgi:pSer/pThr/pTyr-binding forkhead associated (FHA) protein
MGKTGEGEGGNRAEDDPAQRSLLQLAVFWGETVAVHALPASGEITIGRAAQNNVQIRDPAVSRKHAVLRIGPEVRVECLSRRNKLFVSSFRQSHLDPTTSGRERRQVVGPVEVALGDSILMGSSVLVIRRAVTSGALDSGDETLGDGVLPPLAPEDKPEPPAISKLFAQARRVARASLNVVITGEAGSGKKFLARLIHLASARAGRPFRTQSCNALSDELLESELFGYEKGMAPEAAMARPGILEMADGGTVYLDEVDALPLPLQGRLRIALDEKTVFRVGGRTGRAVDVRVIAATRRDLEQEVARGAFREDLLVALRGARFVIPPLRERVGDIAFLAGAFLAESCKELQRPTVPALSPEALSALQHYPWPRNVVELHNVIANAAALCLDDTVNVEDLCLHPVHTVPPPVSDRLEAGRPTLEPPAPAPLPSFVLLLPTSKFQLVYDAAVKVGTRRESLFASLDPAFFAALPTEGDHAQQLFADLTRLKEVPWLEDGTVPLVVWLGNAVTLAGPTASRQVFQDALDHVRALFSALRLPEEELVALRDAAIAVTLDAKLLLANLDPGFVSRLAQHPDRASQILGDLRALDEAGLVGEKVALQAWLRSASTLRGDQVESRAFGVASAHLIALMGHAAITTR